MTASRTHGWTSEGCPPSPLPACGERSNVRIAHSRVRGVFRASTYPVPAESPPHPNPLPHAFQASADKSGAREPTVSVAPGHATRYDSLDALLRRSACREGRDRPARDRRPQFLPDPACARRPRGRDGGRGRRQRPDLRPAAPGEVRPRQAAARAALHLRQGRRDARPRLLLPPAGAGREADRRAAAGDAAADADGVRDLARARRSLRHLRRALCRNLSRHRHHRLRADLLRHADLLGGADGNPPVLGHHGLAAELRLRDGRRQPHRPCPCQSTSQST